MVPFYPKILLNFYIVSFHLSEWTGSSVTEYQSQRCPDFYDFWQIWECFMIVHLAAVSKGENIATHARAFFFFSIKL